MKDKAAARVWMGSAFFIFAWIMTLFAMLTSNSMAVMTDFVNTTLDCLSLAISWFVDRRISNKKSALYTYGTGKIESLVALVIGSAFFCSMVGVSIALAYRFANPQKTEGVGIWIVLFFAFFFAGTNLIMFIKTRAQYRETGKAHLEAELRIYRIKIFANSGLFFSVLISSWPLFSVAIYFDPAYAVFLLIMMGSAMVHLFRRNLGVIFDEVAEEAVQVKVTQVLAKHFAAYDDYCGMRSRRSGDKPFVEVFLAFDPEQSTGDTLAAMEMIRSDMEAELPRADITIVCSPPGRAHDL